VSLVNLLHDGASQLAAVVGVQFTLQAQNSHITDHLDGDFQVQFATSL
jgi:hypothetical protein